jgi:hypothetical protein
MMIMWLMLFGLALLVCIPVHALTGKRPARMKSVWMDDSADKNPFYKIQIDKPVYEKNKDGDVETHGSGRGLLVVDYDYTATEAFSESESPSESESVSESESPSISPSESIATAQSPVISGIGGPCNIAQEPDINGGCKIGLVCNSNYICVGPERTGGNCNTSNSNYLCVNGNWCHCDPALFGDACYCEAERQDGASCDYDYECRGKSGCNRGTCTKWFSVGKGDASDSFDYCKPGLLFDSVGQICVNPDQKSCITQLDCAPGWPGVTDNIFYKCNNNKCHYDGKDCWSYLANTNTYLDFNSYYDGGRERLPIETLEMYAWCVYQSYHAKGASPSPTELYRQATDYSGEYFTNIQTEWVDTGGNCANPATRCKMGSYCTNHTCVLFPGVGDDCGSIPGAENDRGKYYMCDVTDFYECNRFIVDDHTPNYVGPVGKCVKGTAKKGNSCSSNVTVYSGTAVYEYTFCDHDKGYYCNYDHNVGDYYTGRCAKPASVGAGMVASDDFFCKNGLAFGYYGPGWPLCVNLNDTGVDCTSWHDCIDFELAYVGFYYDDYHYVDEPYEYGWTYGEYYRRQVECNVGKCYFVNTNSCQKQLEKASEYTRIDQFYPNNCHYLECQLVNDTTPDYTFCSSQTGASTSLRVTLPSTVVTIALTIIGLLFGSF